MMPAAGCQQQGSDLLKHFTCGLELRTAGHQRVLAEHLYQDGRQSLLRCSTDEPSRRRELRGFDAQLVARRHSKTNKRQIQRLLAGSISRTLLVRRYCGIEGLAMRIERAAYPKAVAHDLPRLAESKWPRASASRT